tara:strand:+ start:12378 stop:12776 length:399 start_codon:yes stop_codon:yes gene_type:complete
VLINKQEDSTMSLLSYQLFGHCSESGEEANTSALNESEYDTPGFNEATGLPLLPSGVKGCPGVIDVEGNPRGTDMSDHLGVDITLDISSMGTDVIGGCDIHSDTDWMTDTTSIDSGFDDFGINDLTGCDGDW